MLVFFGMKRLSTAINYQAVDQAKKKYQIKFLLSPTERDENGLALSSRNNTSVKMKKLTLL